MPESFLKHISYKQGKMQGAIANMNRYYDEMTDFIRQYIVETTVEWAKLVVSHPKTTLVIVETTPIVDDMGNSYTGESEPIRITTFFFEKETYILDQLICPTISKDVKGTEYHGLSWSDVREYPRFDEVLPRIEEHLKDRVVIIFNADWARQALSTVSRSDIFKDALCLHNKAKEYYGQFYELSLQTVLEYQGINKTRDQLKDSRERILMLAQVVRNLAAGMKKVEPEPEPEETDLDEHPF
jgi:DNA polymerase III epsilon subunit-like protein